MTTRVRYNTIDFFALQSSSPCLPGLRFKELKLMRSRYGRYRQRR